ncbi:MAG TPA: cation:proton antiporter [Gaiellaceae bacterium]|jgi:NhaP-type Na+/H+ or K+/H+ antiporter|nr:cation:proton antiporter [Gaiellaceae bacterium]
MTDLLAAAPGFSTPDLYTVGLIFLGVALAAAVGALSHEEDRAFSAALIYLVLGLAAAAVVGVFDLRWLDPVDDSEIVERLAEFAVIIALFSTGLKLDRDVSWRAWRSVARLLGIAMPLTIAAVALFANLAMGLSVGAAIVLAAVLAPTDPVLAGDIGVGPPGEEEEREPNFAITAEAGLNDGFAFPFVLLGIFVAGHEGWGWFVEWAVADLLWAVGAGTALGAAIGYGLAWLAVRLRSYELLAPEFDGWLAIPAVLVVYGVTEVVGAYGFLAAFAGGMAFRRYERDHELNTRVHEGAEVAEKLAELSIILLLGSMVTLGGLARPGWSGWLLVPVLLFVVRPAVVAVSFLGSGRPWRERLFLGWFGVRGIGSLYYAAFAVGLGALGTENAEVVWTATACVLCSIFLHGVTGAPLARRWVHEVD